jgi:hypothetical protein
MSAPAANVTEVPASVGIAPTSSTKVCVFFGCSSKGALLTPTPFGSYKDCASSFGSGPTVKAAAYSNVKTNANFVFIRLPAAVVAATTSAVVKTGTGTFVATITGTPLDNYEVVLIWTTGGTIGTSASYKYSLDGGTTFTAIAALGVATTISLTGTGLTVNLTAGHTAVALDQIVFNTFPASSSIQPLTTTRVAASTSAITAAGSPNDDYDVIFRVIAGGTIGVAGITYQLSLDGGRTFSATTALGVANSLLLPDGVESTGVTLSFAAGTLDSLDKVTFKTFGPVWQSSDATLAFTALRSSNLKWSFLHGVGPSDAALAGSVGGTLAGWAAGTKFAWAALSARDKGTNETQAQWIARLLANFAAFADTRVAEGAGMARITCPITGRQNRRPAMWTAVPRIIANAPQVDPGKKQLGPLSSDVSIHDDSNQLIELDSRINSALHDARFLTLRSYDDEAGVFIARGNLMGPDTDIQRIAYRVVLNIAEEVYQKAMTIQIQSEFRLWPQGVKAPYKAGDVYEPHALRIQREIQSALVSNITEQGMASAVTVSLNRTPVSLGSGKYKLVCNVRVTPLGYIDEFSGTIGYTNPALDAIINAA